MALRTCRDCGLEAHFPEDLIKFKPDKSMKHGRRNTCYTCFKKRYPESPQKISAQNKRWREKNPDYMKNKLKKQFNFEGNILYPDENPRSNVCSECGRSYPKDMKRQTCIHHIIYDAADPLAWTVELCQSCHMKLHWALRRNNCEL